MIFNDLNNTKPYIFLNNVSYYVNCCCFSYLCGMINNNDLIVTALENLKIEELNPMQKASLEASTSPNDVVLLSPTGSGKTLAFLLPLIANLSRSEMAIQALILTPSRELALQIESVFKSMNTPWKSCCCYGGHPIAQEKRSIQGSSPAVIIGTPGRVADHIYKGNFNPYTIHTLIIDEFDKSLEFGFHDDMAEIIEQLPSIQKRMLISATDAEEIPEFTDLGQTTRLDFLVKDADITSRLTLKTVVSPSRDKVETLHSLLCSLGTASSIVFCNHREPVDRISDLLAQRGLYTEPFHGGMEQPDRERALYKFRNGSCQILVATDLAARGLDIPEVEHIIHYHMPPQEDAFTHRNGRTARWQASGTSYIMTCDGEPLPKYIDSQIEEHTLPSSSPLPPLPLWVTLYLSKGKKDKLSRMDIAGFLYKKGGLVREDVGTIDVREHYSFVAVRRSKVKSLMSLIRGEKIKGIRMLIEEAN